MRMKTIAERELCGVQPMNFWPIKRRERSENEHSKTTKSTLISLLSSLKTQWTSFLGLPFGLDVRSEIMLCRLL